MKLYMNKKGQRMVIRLIIGAVAAAVERTIVAGDQSKLSLKYRQK